MMIKQYVPSVHSRRDVLRAAVGVGAATLLAPAWLQGQTQPANPDEMDPRLEKVLKATIGVDMHNHVSPAGTDRDSGPGGGGLGGGGPGGDRGPGDDRGAATRPVPGISEALHAIGLTAVSAAFKVDFARGDLMVAFDHWLDGMDKALATDGLTRAMTLADLVKARDSGKPTIVQGTEGAHFLAGDLARVERVYKRGLRHLQLFHDRDDMVKSMGDNIGNRGPSHGGLTAFGADVIRECGRLGILVDLAHGTFDTVMAGAKVADRPFLVSHVAPGHVPGSDPRMAMMMKSRSLNKDQAKAIGDAGGVIGVWTKGLTTPAQYVAALHAMVEMAGVDHVGIGTDSDLLSTRAGQSTASTFPHTPGPFFPLILAEMLRQGFSPEDAAKVGGGNFCRAFDAAVSGHA